MKNRCNVFRPFLTVFGLALAVLTGCRESGTEEAGGSTVSDARHVLATCSFTPIALSPAGAVFTDISDIDVDSKGRIYVSDYEAPFVTVLSSDGTVLRKIGRKGEGPGEFDYVVGVQALSGDSLMVYDRGLRRITVFAPESDQVAYTINLAATSPLRPPSAVRKLLVANAFLVTSAAPFSSSGDPAADYNRKQITHLLDADGSVLGDSILTTRAGQIGLIARRPGGGITAMANPFGRPGAIEVANERIYYGWGDSLAIVIYSMTGDRIGGFSMHHESPPVTEQDILKILDSESEVSTFAEPLRNFLAEHADGSWPAFKNFVVDNEGRIWIGLITPNGLPTRWMAFSESGKRLCGTSLPENVKLELISDSKAYGVITNEFDVPRVITYRVNGEDETS